MAEWTQIAEEMESYASQETKSKTLLESSQEYLTDKIAKVTALKDELAISHPSISEFIGNHINRSPGTFGTFGLAAGAAMAVKQATTLDSNKTVGTYLAEVYRAKADGKSMSDISTPPAIPGGGSSADPNDADATIVLPNRTAFPAVRTENQYAIGSLICVNGYVCVYAAGSVAETDGALLTNGWAKLTYIMEAP